MKFCKDCEWFGSLSPTHKFFYKCLHPSVTQCSMVDGATLAPTATEMRVGATCGRHAKLFEPKES